MFVVECGYQVRVIGVMSDRRAVRQPSPIAVGFAASSAGEGVAYARLLAPAPDPVLRTPFRLAVQPALRGRDVSYAALRAVAADVRARGIARVQFHLDDEWLLLDLNERRALPQALVLPYVALRCELNRLHEVSIVSDEASVRDLAARARAEVCLNVAA
jgi:GNAT superfamily N-acetyltransferase